MKVLRVLFGVLCGGIIFNSVTKGIVRLNKGLNKNKVKKRRDDFKDLKEMHEYILELTPPSRKVVKTTKKASKK